MAVLRTADISFMRQVYCNYSCVHVALVLRLFALTSLDNIHYFLIYVVIFGLTPLGWLISIAPIPTYSIISYGNIIIDLRLTSIVIPRVIQCSVRPPSWDCI